MGEAAAWSADAWFRHLTGLSSFQKCRYITGNVTIDYCVTFCSVHQQEIQQQTAEKVTSWKY